MTTLVSRAEIDPFDRVHVRPVETSGIGGLVRDILRDGWSNTMSPMILHEKPEAAKRYSFWLIDGQHRNLALDYIEAHPEQWPSGFKPPSEVKADVLRADSPRILCRIIGNRLNTAIKAGALGDCLWSRLCSWHGFIVEAAKLHKSLNALYNTSNGKIMIQGVKSIGNFRNIKQLLHLQAPCLARIRTACQEEESQGFQLGSTPVESLEDEEKQSKRKYKVAWTRLYKPQIIKDHDKFSAEAKVLWIEKMLKEQPKVASEAYYLTVKKRLQRIAAVKKAVKKNALPKEAGEELIASVQAGFRDLEIDMNFEVYLQVGRTSSADGKGSAASQASASSDVEMGKPVEASHMISSLIRVQAGDAFELLDAETSLKAQLILTDPPYGVLKEGRDKRLMPEEYRDLARMFAQHLSKTGTLLMFSDFHRASETLTALRTADLVEFQTFFKWIKTNVRQAKKCQAPTSSCEALLYMKKRDRGGKTANFTNWKGNPYDWRFLDQHLMATCSDAEASRRNWRISRSFLSALNRSQSDI